MKIAIINFKGGQGKTSIAINLALTLNINVITNDKFTTAKYILPERQILIVDNDSKEIPTLKKEYEKCDIIYDFGGYIDLRTGKVIKEADLIIIPIINNFINISPSIHTIHQVYNINKNILIIANSVINNDLDVIKEHIYNNLKTEFSMLPLKRSTAFDQVNTRKQSLREICKNSPILAYSYREISKQFDDIIDYINSIKKNK